MTMLASEEITIQIDREAIRLRPTLRAAMRLERTHGGFQALARKIAEENLSAMASVIREAATTYSPIPDLIEEIGEGPLGVRLECLVEPLIRFVFQLAGIDEDAAPEEIETDSKITFGEHHIKLYRIATGWLGWTPDQAWNATPNEIAEAYKGRCEMLKALFGSSEDEEKPKDLAMQAKLALARFPITVVKPDEAA